MALTTEDKQAVNELLKSYYDLSANGVPYFQFDIPARRLAPIPPKMEHPIVDLGSSTESKPSLFNRVKFLLKPLLVSGCIIAACFIVSLIVAIILT